MTIVFNTSFSNSPILSYLETTAHRPMVFHHLQPSISQSMAFKMACPKMLKNPVGATPIHLTNQYPSRGRSSDDEEKDSSYRPLVCLHSRITMRNWGASSHRCSAQFLYSDEDSPLALYLHNAILPPFNMPPLEQYGRIGDFDDHIQSYKTMM